MTTSAPWLTPPEAAKLLGVDPAKVVAWIKSGELAASNVAARIGGKPRFRIDPAELEAFLERRQPKPAPQRKRRRQSTAADYF